MSVPLIDTPLPGVRRLTLNRPSFGGYRERA